MDSVLFAHDRQWSITGAESDEETLFSTEMRRDFIGGLAVALPCGHFIIVAQQVVEGTAEP